MHKQDLTHTPGPLVSTDRNRVPPCGQRRTSISLFFFGNIEGRRGAENNIDPLSLVHHSLQTCFSIITVHNKLFKNPVLVLRFSHFIHRIKHSTSKINPILAVIHSYTHHTLIKKRLKISISVWSPWRVSWSSFVCRLERIRPYLYTLSQKKKKSCQLCTVCNCNVKLLLRH